MMGLKKYTDEIGPEGFTPAVRAQLSAEGKIIDTWDLLHDEAIAAELDAHVPYAEGMFRKNYAKNVESNWQAITDLYDDGNGMIYKKLMSKLHTIYDEDQKPEEELAHKAKLLMKNLVTRWSIARNDKNGRLIFIKNALLQ